MNTRTNPRIPGLDYVADPLRLLAEPEPLNRRIYGWARAPFVGLFLLARWLLRVAAVAAGGALLAGVVCVGAAWLLALGMAVADGTLSFAWVMGSLPLVWRRLLEWSPWFLILTLPVSLLKVR